jgi:hypothetical protein
MLIRLRLIPCLVSGPGGTVAPPDQEISHRPKLALISDGNANQANRSATRIAPELVPQNYLDIKRLVE